MRPPRLARATTQASPAEAGRTAPDCASAPSVASRVHVELLTVMRDGLPRSQRDVLAAVPLPRRQVLAALKQGVSEGWLTEAAGPRRSRVYRINYRVAPLLRRAPSVAPGGEVRRPFDAYDRRRLQVLPRLLELLVEGHPQAVLAAYTRAWRDAGGVEPSPRDERGLWLELAAVATDLLRPVLELVEEYELLPASEHCLIVGAQRRERTRDYGPAECEPCGQIHHLRRR